MVAAVQWSYAQREPLSWSMGLLIGLAAIWGFSGWQANSAPIDPTEMTALLDRPAPQTEPVRSLQRIQPTAQPAATERPVLPIAAPVATTSPLSASPTEAPVRVAESKAALPVAPMASAVPVTPAPTSAEPARPSAAASYEAQLLAYLERIKRYPTSREARLSQPQGVVKLWLEISRNGALIGAGILHSSGSNLLDSEALRTVRTAQLPPFSELAFGGEASHRFSVSLKYQIEGQ